ncbi:MAG: hypothetical protein CMJ58_10315 [Planctomycetaceae bacterium]|nr:hypothetical protein [Planctomycetaceae bacterium]
MNDNKAYDISAELDPVDRLDDVSKRLEERRKQAKQSEAAKSIPKKPAQPRATDAEDLPGGEEAEAVARKRKQEAARKRKEAEEQARLLREDELRESRWVTPSYKAREKRIELLDRIYFRMRADGAFTGRKQEFYDEALALLEEKYGEYARAG